MILLNNKSCYKQRILLILVLFLFLKTPAQQLQIEFNHLVGNNPLQLGQTEHINKYGQPFQVSRLKYYISHITLRNTTGEGYHSDTCFLIDESIAFSKIIQLSNVPKGNYNVLEFIVGVDSIRNSSGAQNGALDPLNGMFWTWNSGYVFFKLEGTSAASKLPGNLIEYHIGGFAFPNNNLKRIALPVSINQNQPIKIELDISKIMMVDFSLLPSIMSSKDGHIIAEKFSTAFSISR